MAHTNQAPRHRGPKPEPIDRARRDWIGLGWVGLDWVEVEGWAPLGSELPWIGAPAPSLPRLTSATPTPLVAAFRQGRSQQQPIRTYPELGKTPWGSRSFGRWGIGHGRTRSWRLGWERHPGGDSAFG